MHGMQGHNRGAAAKWPTVRVATPRQKETRWFTRENGRNIVFVVLAAILAWLCWRVVEPLVTPIAWAVALAVVSWPLHAKLLRWIRRKSLTAALTTLVVGVVLVLPATLVGRQIAQEAVGVATTVQASVKDGSWQAAIERHPVINAAFGWVGGVIDLKQQLEHLAEFVPKAVQKVVSGSLHLASGVVIALFLLFFFVRDHEQMLAALRGLLPLSASEDALVFRRVADTIHAILYGTLAVAVLQGTLGALMFWWLGLPAPLLWGTAMAVLAIVPMVGTAIIWGPAAFYLLLEGSPEKALALTVWGLLVIGLIDNLLQPAIVDKRLHLHLVPVFISLVGGVYAFGVVGLIIGPVVLALALAVLDIWSQRVAADNS